MICRQLMPIITVSSSSRFRRPVTRLNVTNLLSGYLLCFQTPLCHAFVIPQREPARSICFISDHPPWLVPPLCCSAATCFRSSSQKSLPLAIVPAVYMSAMVICRVLREDTYAWRPMADPWKPFGMVTCKVSVGRKIVWWLKFR